MSDYRFILNSTAIYARQLLAAASNNALLMIDVDSVPDQITVTPSFAALPHEFISGAPFYHEYIADTLVLPATPLTLTKSGDYEYGVEWTLPTAVQGTDCYFSTQTSVRLQFVDNIFLRTAIYFQFQARRTDRTIYSEYLHLLSLETLYTAGQLQGYVATNTNPNPLVISATVSY